jgi:haloalkane dehalogenase
MPPSTSSRIARTEPLTAPAWLPAAFHDVVGCRIDIGGARLHVRDEGSGPPLLMLHGNPTWSFLYREIIAGLRDRFRCIAVDLPGFGLSQAPAGYGFTPAEHARVIGALVDALELEGATLMVQDWGGPIGLRVATQRPQRFDRFVLGNTWAWPKSDPGTQFFSRFLGGPVGGWLVEHRNAFVEWIIPTNVKRHKLPDQVMAAYRGPFPTVDSRRPARVFPREILASRAWLAEIERDLGVLRDRRALLVWPTKDIAFGERERRRWEQVFPNHRTVILDGAGHYIQEDAAGEIVTAIRDWNPDISDRAG